MCPPFAARASIVYVFAVDVALIVLAAATLAVVLAAVVLPKVTVPLVLLQLLNVYPVLAVATMACP